MSSKLFKITFQNTVTNQPQFTKFDNFHIWCFLKAYHMKGAYKLITFN